MDRVGVGRLDAQLCSRSPRSGMVGAGVPRSPQSIRHGSAPPMGSSPSVRTANSQCRSPREMRMGAPNVSACSPMVAAISVQCATYPRKRRPSRQWRSTASRSSNPNQRRCGGRAAPRGRRRSPPGRHPARGRTRWLCVPISGCLPPTGMSTPSASRTQATPAPRSGAITAMWSISVICGRSGRRPRGLSPGCSPSPTP